MEKCSQSAGERKKTRPIEKEGGEEKKLEELMTELAETDDSHDEEETRKKFIREDAEEFCRLHPDVDLAALDTLRAFRLFCGSRYGIEPISRLYEDYLELAQEAEKATLARLGKKQSRATGSGGSTRDSSLTAQEQSALEEWNRMFPQMKMSAREYTER